MTGFAYILAEGEADRIDAYRRNLGQPEFFKVGRALEGKNGLTPVEFRLACSQSCNPRRLGVLAALEFKTAAEARTCEHHFHSHHRDAFGVRGGGIEWYGTASSNGFDWPYAFKWFHGKGAADVTKWAPLVASHGGYEETSREFDQARIPQRLFIYLLHLVDEGHSYWRVSALSYAKGVTKFWRVNKFYNLGTPRPITVARQILTSPTPIDIANQAVRNVLMKLHKSHGHLVIPYCRKPNSPWNVLAWFEATKDFDKEFEEVCRTQIPGARAIPFED